jgi:hypothetical protein
MFKILPLFSNEFLTIDFAVEPFKSISPFSALIDLREYIEEGPASIEHLFRALTVDSSEITKTGKLKKSFFKNLKKYCHILKVLRSPKYFYLDRLLPITEGRKLYLELYKKAISESEMGMLILKNLASYQGVIAIVDKTCWETPAKKLMEDMLSEENARFSGELCLAKIITDFLQTKQI